MLARRHPFKSPSKQPPQAANPQLEVLRNICALPPALSRDLSPPAQSLVLRLLAKDPDARLPGGLRALQADPFFAGLDWDALYHRRVPAPYVPALQSGEDTACFPQYYTDERLPDNEVLALTAGAEEDGGGGGGGQGGRRQRRRGPAGVEFLFPGFSCLGCQAWGAAVGREDGDDDGDGETGGWGGAMEQQQQQKQQRQRALLAALPDEEEACFAGFDFCMPIEEEGEWGGGAGPAVLLEQQG